MVMPGSGFDVLCIGNAIVDVIARVDEGFVRRHGLVKGSMNLIDETRAEELYADMGQAIEISGGSAGNTAAGVASLGGRAAYFGKVKADQLGAIFRHDMRAQGVAFDTPSAEEGPATARSFILVTPDSERTMNTYLGACVNFSTRDVDRKTVEAAQVTYMEGYLWDRPEAKEAFKLAAAIARAAGRKTSITLSDSFCVERHRDSFLDLIRNDIDIVFANESEVTSLYRTADFDSAMRAIAKDCPIAVLTRSEKGCIVVEGDDVIVSPAHPVSEVVDVTGAGDLFAAGFLYAYTAGKPLADAARLGSMAAAEVISHIGARPEINLRSHACSLGFL
jgi:sugar/nucleoside kinase (ribokinase family)